MSLQKWRSYGGQNSFETNNNVAFNNLTVGNLSIKNDYIGYFSIQGPIAIGEHANIEGDVTIGGNTTLYNGVNVTGNSNFNNDVSIDGNLVINKSITINGQITIGFGFIFDNDINVNGNIGLAGKYMYFGPKNIYNNYGRIVCNTIRDARFMGINQPIENSNIIPGSTLEVFCDTSNNGSLNAFNVCSNSNRPIQSVISSNRNYQGSLFYTDISRSSLYFFNDHSIPTDTTVDSLTSFTWTSPRIISLTDPTLTLDAEITYKKGGNLLINTPNKTFLPSKVVIGENAISNTDFTDTSLNEKVSIFTNSSNTTPHIYPYYEISSNIFSAANALTLTTNQNMNGSCNSLNLVSNNSLFGMKITGGNYINDTTKSMGVIGLDDDSCGNFIPIQTMVSGNNPSYLRSTLGINTYAPDIDNYTLNINGKTNITNGEIIKIQDLSFQSFGLASCTRNPLYIIAYGTPFRTLPVSGKTNHCFIYSNDGGSIWNNGDISGDNSQTINLFNYSVNYLHSYNTTYSLCAFEGDKNCFFTNSGGKYWSVFTTDSSTCISTTTIRALDMSSSVMIAYTDIRLGPTNDLCYNYLSYSIINNIQSINNYIGENNSNILPTKFFRLPDGKITGMDGFDNSYIFITGSFGIYKYFINPISGIINSSAIPCKTDTSYNNLFTYKSYNSFDKLNNDDGYSIFVGNNIVTITRDGGQTFSNYTVYGKLKSVFIYDLSYSIITGVTSTNYGIIYVTWDGGYNWIDMTSNNLFNTSGVSNLLMSKDKNLNSVCMSSINDILISRIDSTFISGISGQLGNTKIYYCHLPNVFNNIDNTVLDICGSVFIDGYTIINKSLNITNDLTVNGFTEIVSGNLIVSQSGGDSTSTETGVLVIPNSCGMGVSGNVYVGKNVVSGNFISDSDTSLNMYSNNGFINIGSGYNGVNTNIPQNIIIGGDKTYDNINISANILTFNVKTINSIDYDLINLVTTNATNIDLGFQPNIQAYGSGVSFYDPNSIIVPKTTIGKMASTVDGSGFILWAPSTNSNKSIRLDNYNFNLNTGVKSSIVTVAPSSYSDSSYVICNNPLIDISNIILTNSVNAINNIQTIATDVSINGNLYISNGLTVNNNSGSSVIKISSSSIPSTSTNSGSLILNGGLGLNGNIYMSGISVIKNTTVTTGTDSGALVVNGGIGISGNSYIGGNLTIDGSYTYFANSVFINNKNGLGPTKLSMTDFSSNAIFYSTSESTTTNTGAISVYGGIGINKSIYIGGNSTIKGYSYTFNDSSFNSNVYIPNGNLIVNSIYFGSSNTHLSMTDFSSNVTFHSNTSSTSISSGAVIVSGGLGVSGNIYLGESLFFGSSNTYLSMTDFSSNVTFHSNTSSTSTGSGAVIVSGGLGVNGNIFLGESLFFGSSNTHLSMTDFSSNIVLHSTAVSINTDSGAIVVKGGVGIYGNTFIGNLLNVDGNGYFKNSLFIDNGSTPTKLSMTDFSSNVTFHSNTSSTSTGSGAVIVSGGLGVSGNIYLGDSLFFGPDSTELSMTDFLSNVTFHSTTNSTTTNNGSIVTYGGIGIVKDAYIGGNVTIDGSYAYFADSVFINNKNGLGKTKLSMTDFSSNVTFYSTTDATSTNIGAVCLRGGLGISGNVYIGKNITIDGSYAYFNDSVFINNKNGLGPTKLSMTDFSSNVTFHSTSNSTTTNTGSIIVSGGIGINGNVNIGKFSHIYGTIDSTSTGSGSLIVDGGIGINGNIYSKGYNGGTTSSSSFLNIGRTTCYSLQSLTTVNVSGGITIAGGQPGTITGGSLYLSNNSGLYSTGTMYCANTTDSISTSTGAIQVLGGMGIVGNVFVGGQVSATSVVQTSDYRIKDNIIELDNSYTVDNFKPIHYLNRLNNKEEIGFLAHQIQDIYPFLVNGDKDGNEHQSLNYIGIIGILVKEIQELKNRIHNIENSI